MGGSFRTGSAVENPKVLRTSDNNVYKVENISKTEPSATRTVGLVAGIGAGILVLSGSYIMLSGIGVFGGGD